MDTFPKWRNDQTQNPNLEVDKRRIASQIAVFKQIP